MTKENNTLVTLHMVQIMSLDLIIRDNMNYDINEKVAKRSI